MKTPAEVRADLNAAREAYKTRHEVFRVWGVTAGPWSMQDWAIREACDDDKRWQELVDMYVSDYERLLARDAELRAEAARWREGGGR
jgi:hypothetical protein